jgi:predicted short-subunit dehydrogenase-like oxidoreductase (DUF2520 family)
MRTLTIVGAGKVGRVLGRLLANTVRIGQVLNRTPASAAEAVAFIGAGTVAEDVDALRRADIVLLAAGDSQLPALAQQLAARGLAGPGVTVFHCSGALGSDALAPVRAAGAACASVHPVRTFADPESVARHFAGTHCCVEGDADALAVLAPLCDAIGAVTVPVAAERKLVYHAASVFACNYLTTLVDTALRAYGAAGIPEEQARAMAAGLIGETLDNLFKLGPAAALTGPIARGDTALVARQAQAVADWDAQAGELYRAFIAPTTSLAGRR